MESAFLLHFWASPLLFLPLESPDLSFYRRYWNQSWLAVSVLQMNKYTKSESSFGSLYVKLICLQIFRWHISLCSKNDKLPSFVFLLNLLQFPLHQRNFLYREFWLSPSWKHSPFSFSSAVAHTRALNSPWQKQLIFN